MAASGEFLTALVTFRADLVRLKRELDRAEKEARSRGAALGKAASFKIRVDRREFVREIDQSTNKVKELNRALAETDRRGSRAGTGRIPRIGGSASGGAGGLLAGIGIGPTAVGALGVGFLTRETVQLADTFTTLQNRLKTVTDGTEDLTRAQTELFSISQRTRSGFEQNVELFTRVSLATRELGLSQRDVLQFTESLNQAILLSGASSQEANAALIQLSQGLASGALRGDELRSVLEQLPTVADVIAKELGVTRGELRGLGQDGQITADVIIRAFANAREELNDEFAKNVGTVAQSFTQLGNAALATVGKIDSATGASRALAEALTDVSRQIEVLGDIAAGAQDAKRSTESLRLELEQLAQVLDEQPSIFGRKFAIDAGVFGETVDEIQRRRLEIAKELARRKELIPSLGSDEDAAAPTSTPSSAVGISVPGRKPASIGQQARARDRETKARERQLARELENQKDFLKDVDRLLVQSRDDKLELLELEEQDFLETLRAQNLAVEDQQKAEAKIREAFRNERERLNMEALEREVRASQQAADKIRQEQERALRELSSALADIAIDGEDAFKRLKESFLRDFIEGGIFEGLKLINQKLGSDSGSDSGGGGSGIGGQAASLLFNLGGKLFGGGGGGGSSDGGGSGDGLGKAVGFLSSIGSFFGGFFADGGRPPRGRVSVVGERGPELFVPDVPGTIVPGSAAGGGSASVNVQVINNAPVRVSVDRRTRDAGQGQTLRILVDQVKREIGEDIMRGGTVGQAIERGYEVNRSAIVR